MGLHCCLSFAHAAVSGLYSLVAVGGLLIAVTPLAEHGLQGEGASAGPALRLQSSGSVALERRLTLLRSMWDLAGSGIESMSLAWVGGFFTTEGPAEPLPDHF